MCGYNVQVVVSVGISWSLVAFFVIAAVIVIPVWGSLVVKLLFDYSG